MTESLSHTHFIDSILLTACFFFLKEIAHSTTVAFFAQDAFMQQIIAITTLAFLLLNNPEVAAIVVTPKPGVIS
jgi:hypothetical protein